MSLMKIAVMQPYLFPYIGYFQLMVAVQKFVVFDDVHFINKGWINRNNILINGKPHLFTIPLKNASQNRLIKDIEIVEANGWRGKFFKTLEMGYRKAPYFTQVFTLVEKIMQVEKENISQLIVRSLQVINDYLSIEARIVTTSAVYQNEHLKGQSRIIDICRREGADHYINPAGGKDLYDHATFEQNQLQLSFIKSLPIRYQQFDHDFVPWLSMVDVLMFNGKEQVRALLANHILEK